MKIGVLGAGTMGAGIAQVAAQNGHNVVLVDLNQNVIDTAQNGHQKMINRLVEKGSITQAECDQILGAVHYTTSMSDLKDCGLVIEAIIEDLAVKHRVFSQMENIVGNTC